MRVFIDPSSGFCSGVTNAISRVENELAHVDELFCLGEMVHNEAEIDRLSALGLATINRDQFHAMHDGKIVFRAHGEPPESFIEAQANNIQIIDATCPIVRRLQQKVKQAWTEQREAGGQVVIAGVPGHAEVVGLVGQTSGEAIVVNSPEETGAIDFSRPVRLFSQTTMDPLVYQKISERIRENMQKQQPGGALDFVVHDTICRQVSGRAERLRKFAGSFDIIIFVSGRNSSNGRILFEVCKESNSNCHMVSKPEDLDRRWFEGCVTAGVSGATSTPLWLMKEVAAAIEKYA